MANSATNEKAEQLFAVINSIREFDKHKLSGIISAIISPSDRENCFLATYYRTAGYIDSLLALNHIKHFQAAAMIARSLFELAADITLIDKVPAGPLKMIFFAEVEKLYKARKMIAFAVANPDRGIDVSAQTEFVAKNEQRIENNHRTLWPPSPPATALPALTHWSAMRVSKRMKLLGDPFDEAYNFHYPRLSWYVHSGLTGVINLPSEYFLTLSGFALGLSMTFYSTILEAVIREMKIDRADDKIHKTLKYATLLPFTKTPEDEAALFRGLLG